MSFIRYCPFPAEPPGGPHEVLLLPERAVYWPHQRTLMIADVHLGKTQTFWNAGAPIPEGVLEADLARLALLLRRTEAARLIVLGDLLHAGVGLTAALVERVARWRAEWPVHMLIVRGNHDRAIGEVAGAWRMVVVEEAWVEGCFAFRHEPVAAAGVFTWAGHLHPMVRVSTPRDSLRLPCFWMTGKVGDPAGGGVGVLPAFSAFTRGQTIRPEARDGLFAIADGVVVAV
jgi:uncharacterized protein